MKKIRVFENPTECPVTHAINVIGGRWKPIILYCLMGGKLRFGKLALFIPSISRKVLTEQLKELEYCGLVHREAFNETPPKVEYSLTELGKTLLPVLNALCDWGAKVGQHITKEKGIV